MELIETEGNQVPAIADNPITQSYLEVYLCP